MKVPSNIKEAIKECAEANNKARFNEIIIIRWLEKHKLTEETCTDINRDMVDSFIDCCQISYNPDKFIEILENLLEE